MSCPGGRHQWRNSFLWPPRRRMYIVYVYPVSSQVPSHPPAHRRSSPGPKRVRFTSTPPDWYGFLPTTSSGSKRKWGTSISSPRRPRCCLARRSRPNWNRQKHWPGANPRADLPLQGGRGSAPTEIHASQQGLLHHTPFPGHPCQGGGTRGPAPRPVSGRREEEGREPWSGSQKELLRRPRQNPLQGECHVPCSATQSPLPNHKLVFVLGKPLG